MSPDDYTTMMLEQALATHKRQMALEAEQRRQAAEQAAQATKLTQIEQKVDTLRVGADGWTSCSQAAVELNLKSKTGRRHNEALLAIAAANGISATHFPVSGRTVNGAPTQVQEAHFDVSAMMRLRSIIGGIRTAQPNDPPQGRKITDPSGGRTCSYFLNK